MPLADVTHESVLAAVREFDNTGRDTFLRKYGFGRAREYFLVLNGRRYDSKAIAGAAHKFAVPAAGPLRRVDFSGGELTVARELRRLGFEVDGPEDPTLALPMLAPGRIYSWDELASAFKFKPSLFQVAGGMLPRPEFNALLLITHPGGARSFDYEDRWEGDTLVYTGRGKTGDQRLDGANRDAAENRKYLIVLEAVETRRLRYVGEATCIESWKARAPDSQGQQRDVWKFRLSFSQAVALPVHVPQPPTERNVLRRPRPFSPPDGTASRRAAQNKTTPEETAVLQEKANREHCRLVARLSELLTGASWTSVEEIPAALDLWGVPPDGSGRIVFEVKSLSESNEVHQCRAALAQLLEYRFFYGEDSDRLCVVLNGPIADRRRVFLENLGVAVVVIDGEGAATAIGQLASEWFGRMPFQASRTDEGQ